MEKELTPPITKLSDTLELHEMLQNIKLVKHPNEANTAFLKIIEPAVKDFFSKNLDSIKTELYSLGLLNNNEEEGSSTTQFLEIIHHLNIKKITFSYPKTHFIYNSTLL